MKILNREQIQKADSASILAENITSADLMERAGERIMKEIRKYLSGQKIQIFCGVGNNGGDGLVVARLLQQSGHQVEVAVIHYLTEPSSDFKVNLERLKECGVEIMSLEQGSAAPEINSQDLIIDAIFGSGLSREPEPWVATLIRQINGAQARVISIDLPSGLFLDRPTKDLANVIHANLTLTFHVPKLVLYLPDTALCLGEVKVINLDLNQQFIDSLPAGEFVLTRDEVLARYRPIPKFAHKGRQGHCLIIGGSYGKIGSVVLAARSALRSGCGLVTVYLPRCGEPILQTANPEAMVITDSGEKEITAIQYQLQPQAIAIGMGMGKAQVTQKTFKEFLKNNKCPLIIDADGLNMLAADLDLLKTLPENSILTPHPRELERLIGRWEDDFDKINKVKQLASKYRVIVVIKGAHSMIVSAEQLFINTTGNPGMATAGSGDVLSGMIGSLLAQGYPAIDAAILAVYLHGSTSDIYAETEHFQSFIASDIISNIGKAFNRLIASRPVSFSA